MINSVAISVSLAASSQSFSAMDALLEIYWPTRFATVTLLTLATVGIVVLIYLRLFYVDYPNIKGIPEIPGGKLLTGHLCQLGNDHATTAEKWAMQYDWPVFQIRLGRRRAIILNSFEAAQEWMVKNQAATLDRPWFYTFHGVVSATSGEYKSY